MNYYAVCYKDKDGFYQHCIDARGRILICHDHDSAMSAMCDQIDYLETRLNGRPKYEVVPTRKLLFFKSSKIIKTGIEYDDHEFERDRIRRERHTICIRKVRVIL